MHVEKRQKLTIAPQTRNKTDASTSTPIRAQTDKLLLNQPVISSIQSTINTSNSMNIMSQSIPSTSSAIPCGDQSSKANRTCSLNNSLRSNQRKRGSEKVKTTSSCSRRASKRVKSPGTLSNS